MPVIADPQINKDSNIRPYQPYQGHFLLNFWSLAPDNPILCWIVLKCFAPALAHSCCVCILMLIMRQLRMHSPTPLYAKSVTCALTPVCPRGPLCSNPWPPFAQLCNNKSMQPVPARAAFLSPPKKTGTFGNWISSGPLPTYTCSHIIFVGTTKEKQNIWQLDQLYCAFWYPQIIFVEPQRKVMVNYISDQFNTLDNCNRYMCLKLLEPRT